MEMLDLVKDLAEDIGATVLMVTRSPDDTLRLGGLTVLVADSEVNPPRDTAELLADPPDSLRACLADGPRP